MCGHLKVEVNEFYALAVLFVFASFTEIYSLSSLGSAGRDERFKCLAKGENSR